MNKQILIKTPKQIQNITESGKYLNELLTLVYTNCKAGVSLLELEIIAENFMKKNNVKWAFKWFNGYPANLCLSVDDCVVHWIPDDYILKNGDLLKVDTGVNYEKWISDSAFSIVIGWEYNNQLWYELLETTKQALDNWLLEIWPWKPIYNFSKTVFNTVKNGGFEVIKDLTWHWVWVSVHEPPHIYNRPHSSTKNITFQEWMVIALEPITAVKSTQVILRWNNDWNLYCKKWDLWAQREYMVLITENGYKVLSGLQKIP